MLIASAAGSPEEIYPEGDGSFAFRRAVSRLHEMQSVRYIAERARPPSSSPPAGSTESEAP